MYIYAYIHTCMHTCMRAGLVVLVALRQRDGAPDLRRPRENMVGVNMVLA